MRYFVLFLSLLIISCASAEPELSVDQQNMSRVLSTLHEGDLIEINSFVVLIREGGFKLEGWREHVCYQTPKILEKCEPIAELVQKNVRVIKGNDPSYCEYIRKFALQ